VSAQPATKSRPKLTREQSARVRELVEDEGNTRAEAIAWVLAFEPAVAK
jgi:hypothetical protein